MALPAAEIRYQQLHIEDDRSPDVIASIAICLPAAYLAVALRFVSRRVAGAKLLWDDWLIVIALVRDPATVSLRHPRFFQLRALRTALMCLIAWILLTEIFRF
jgi:hypothetical protein